MNKEIVFPDFTKAKVGDRVYSRLHGHMEVIEINWDSKDEDDFIVCSNKTKQASYFRYGRYYANHLEPTLFWSDGNGNNYLTERPVSYDEYLPYV